jgi:hypothetical protein
MAREKVEEKKLRQLDRYHKKLIDLDGEGKLLFNISYLMRKKCKQIGGICLSTYYSRTVGGRSISE